MTPMSVTLSHLRLLVLWVTESFVSCVCTKPTMCPGLSTTTGSSNTPHTAPAHTQKAARHPSVPSAGGKSKSSWHSPQSPSTFQTPGTFCWSNTFIFFTDLHPANILLSLQGDGIAQASDQQESWFPSACRGAPAPLLFVHILWNLCIQHCPCQSHHQDVHVVP